MIFLPRLFTKKLQFVSPEEKIHQELASVTGTVTNYKTNDNKILFFLKFWIQLLWVFLRF